MTALPGRIREPLARLWWLRRLRARARLVRPPVGAVRFGSLRRLEPVSDAYGFDRGVPIDRYYVEGFLARHAGDIRGRVLEVEDAVYARRFGGWRDGPGDGPVKGVDILDVNARNPRATIIDDLAVGSSIESEAYDCIICTQTLQLIYDVGAACRTLHRALRPGGALLLTVPGITRGVHPEPEGPADYWRFTSLAACRLFEEAFAPAELSVEAYGNLLSAAAFLYGLAAEELTPLELDARDPAFPVTVAVRAVRGKTLSPRA
jgi:SAM-dependent methyltransferase